MGNQNGYLLSSFEVFCIYQMSIQLFKLVQQRFLRKVPYLPCSNVCFLCIYQKTTKVGYTGLKKRHQAKTRLFTGPRDHYQDTANIKIFGERPEKVVMGPTEPKYGFSDKPIFEGPWVPILYLKISLYQQFFSKNVLFQVKYGNPKWLFTQFF